MLIAGETAAGIPGTPIKQSFQPTEQGANSKPTAYLHKIADHRYGWTGRFDTIVQQTINTEPGQYPGMPGTQPLVTADPDPLQTENNVDIQTEDNNDIDVQPSDTIDTTSVIQHQEIQQYETTFQLSTLTTQNPSTPQQYTASDICNLCASILQSDAAITTLQAQGVGIERITDVRNPYFKDDRGQFEASPSFDFTVTHKQIITTTTPEINTFVFQEYII